MQSKTAEFPTLTVELAFVTLCSMSQALFALFLGDIVVNQVTLLDAMTIAPQNTPWIVGAVLLASGITVVIFGSLADLVNPKWLMSGCFAWLTIWNLIGGFTLTPSLSGLFFFMRAMQGLTTGAMQATAISMLGRTYKPGIRKTRAFATTSAMTPVGFCVGCLQGGALSTNLPWIYVSNTILCGACGVVSVWALPSLPVGDPDLSLKNFDVPGALCAAAGCGLVILGLTQGVPSNWNTYTYCLMMIGVDCFFVFYLVERRATRSLIDNRLWTTPGFGPLAISYFFGYGAYIGGWMFYAVQFFLTVQGQRPLVVALYMSPNVVSGVLTTWLVAKTLHAFPGHWILAVGDGSLHHGSCVLPSADCNNLLLGTRCAGHSGARPIVCRCLDLHHLECPEVVPRLGRQCVGDHSEPGCGRHDCHRGLGWRVNQLISWLPARSRRSAQHLVVQPGVLGTVICAAFVRIPRSEEKDHVQ